MKEGRDEGVEGVKRRGREEIVIREWRLSDINDKGVERVRRRGGKEKVISD